MMKRHYKGVFKVCPKFTGARILDIGCGTGDLMQILGKRNEVFGIERDKKCYAACKKKGLHVKNIDIDGKKLPYKEKSFNAVFAVEMIQYIKKTDLFLSEVRRVMKDDGIFIITAPNPYFWYYRICDAAGIDFKNKHFKDDLYMFDKKKLLKMLKPHFYAEKIGGNTLVPLVVRFSDKFYFSTNFPFFQNMLLRNFCVRMKKK